jgi:vacuolar iron transporter family protein
MDKDQLEKKIADVKKAHKDKIAHEMLHSKSGGTYIKDLVYGANDGIITTFAVVAGVAGAGLSPTVVLILGFSNLVADGLSMAIGNYLGTRSEEDYIRREQKMEEWEIEHVPEEEKAEIRQIYRKKGFKGADLENAVAVITSDKKQWVREMMVEELGLIPEEESSQAIKNGVATFIAFVIAGFLPLIPYTLGMIGESAFTVAIIMTAVAMFAIGASRVLITKGNWLKSGIEMLFVGLIAAVFAYGIGYFIESLV